MTGLEDEDLAARAIFTGFPTVELARIIAERVIPDPGLTGLYHVSSDPISKYDLLGLFAGAYGKTNEIVRDESFACDRSLDSGRFRSATGYRPPPWPDLVRAMHEDGEVEVSIQDPEVMFSVVDEETKKQMPGFPQEVKKSLQLALDELKR